jgi:MFS transporter, OPA family, sugar phosphate sensor protein UhpC
VSLLDFYKPGAAVPRLQDPAEIDRKYKSLRLRTILTITIGYGLMYTTRLPLSIVKKPLLDSGLFSAKELGIIGAGMFYGYAFGKFFNGFIADHANVRKIFATGMLLSAGINLIMGTNTLFFVWFVLWIFNGWFQGFGAPTSVVVLARWFGNRERGTYYGLWSTAHSIGEGLTWIFSSTLVAALGWRAGFWGPGTACVIGGVVAYLMLRERPETEGLPPVSDWKDDHCATDKNSKEKSTGKLQLEVLRSPKIWILGMASAMMYISRYAINSWGVLYLQEAKGYTLTQAGSILGVNAFGGIVGAAGYGWISDRLFRARRPPVTLIFGLLEVASLYTVFYSPFKSPVALTIAFAVFGFTLSGLLATLGGLFAVDIMPKRVAGAAMGMIGIFSYLASATQDVISGYMIDAGKTVVNGVTTYDFSTAKLFWVIPSVLSMIFAALLWKVKPAE